MSTAGDDPKSSPPPRGSEPSHHPELVDSRHDEVENYNFLLKRRSVIAKVDAALMNATGQVYAVGRFSCGVAETAIAIGKSYAGRRH